MVQFARPDADQAVNSWTVTPLWSKVDEGSDGGDTIASDAVGNNINTSNGDLRLSDVTDPAVSTGHIIRARWASSSVRDIVPHCELWEGVPDTGTLRAALVGATLLDATEVTDTFTLTGTESDSITDYTDLYIRLWGRGTGGGPDRALVVEFCELEVPDSLTSGAGDHALILLAQGGTALETIPSVGAHSLALLAQLGTAEHEVIGTGNHALQSLAQSGNALLTISATGAHALQLLAQVSTALETIPSTGAHALALLAQSGSALLTITAIGAHALALLAQAGTALHIQSLTSTGAHALTLLAQSGFALLTITSTGNHALALLVQSGTALLTIPSSGAHAFILLAQIGTGSVQTGSFGVGRPILTGDPIDEILTGDPHTVTLIGDPV